jgi:hypothetical protein
LGMLQRLTETFTGTGHDMVPISEVQAQVAAERAELFMVKEAYADLERLYAEDIGWRKIGDERSQLTQQGRDAMAQVADVMATGNPLIKSGVGLRIAYVWGLGVDVGIADDGSQGQDVNAVWQAFWDEPSNRREFTASEAQARYERRLATRGEAFWAFPTDPRTGRVWVRHLPAKEMVDRICDPEDAATVWYYKRVWNAVVVNPTTGARETKARVTYYPALGYYPARRPAYVDEGGGQQRKIRWDAPVRHVAVNQPDEEWRGLGDALPALPWARMDKEFLEDLAVYMRALTRILGQVTGKNSKTAKAAADALRNAAATLPAPAGVPGQSNAGAWAVTDPNTAMSLVSKSGAQIDSNSHRPLATNVAAALEVPLTMLLGDPGQTGARAVAETLDQPTELKFKLRRQVHQELFRDVATYVIDQAVLAPAGPLRGKVTRDGSRLVIELPQGDDRTVEVKWPDFDSTPLKEFVDAVAAAEELPPLEKFKLYAHVFKLENVDDLVDELTDDEGRWIDPTVTAGQVAVDAHRAGQDPAGAVA